MLKWLPLTAVLISAFFPSAGIAQNISPLKIKLRAFIVSEDPHGATKLTLPSDGNSQLHLSDDPILSEDDVRYGYSYDIIPKIFEGGEFEGYLVQIVLLLKISAIDRLKQAPEDSKIAIVASGEVKAVASLNSVISSGRVQFSARRFEDGGFARDKYLKRRSNAEILSDLVNPDPAIKAGAACLASPYNHDRAPFLDPIANLLSLPAARRCAILFFAKIPAVQKLNIDQKYFGPVFADAFRAELQSSKGHERQTLTCLLGYIEVDSEPIINLSSALLKDSDPEIKACAAFALAQHPNIDRTDQICAYLEQEPNTDRVFAIGVLSATNNQSKTECLKSGPVHQRVIAVPQEKRKLFEPLPNFF